MKQSAQSENFHLICGEGFSLRALVEATEHGCMVFHRLYGPTGFVCAIVREPRPTVEAAEAYAWLRRNGYERDQISCPKAQADAGERKYLKHLMTSSVGSARG